MVLARPEEMGHHVPQRFKKPLYSTVSVGNGLRNRCLLAFWRMLSSYKNHSLQADMSGVER
jgi:hypothetical protein